MAKNKVIELLDRYLRGECTPSEVERIDEWFTAHGADKTTLEQMDPARRQVWMDGLLAEIQEINQGHAQVRTRPKRSILVQWGRAAAAAAIVALVAAGIYTYLATESTSGEVTLSTTEADIQPGGNKATLILADGRNVDLSTEKEGIISGEELSYSDGTPLKITEPGGTQPSGNLNVLTTPAGGQYQIELPDGTRVWLNASSTLKYPSRFSKDGRLVELIGEAYFEVVKDPSRPFKVISRNQEIKVLGTSFNVKAYLGETTVTTLVEGSVQVDATDREGGKTLTRRLLPGQEALYSQAGLHIAEADVEAAIAWKNGYFLFNENLESIMAKISRWYDVEVIYESEEAKGLVFWGKISRATPISSVLKIIEMTDNVHFRIETPAAGDRGRRVVVMN